MNWDVLLNSERRKDNSPSQPSTGTAFGRTELERDFDRILFCAPTRRLADKTQVFPLEPNDSVRTRLTHSYEVSNLARGIGTRLVFELHEKIFPSITDQIRRDVPSLLAAIGLAHDLGNPPFGHQGEVAIQKWFFRNKDNLLVPPEETFMMNDFIKFDGNSQTLRLLTRLQILNDNYGLNLTYATIAGLIKYPLSSATKCEHPWKKHGFFLSEKDIVSDVWAKTGLGEGVRHPFTYIMEACDDIAYSVLDAEDIVKKGLASFHDLMDELQSTLNKAKTTTEYSQTQIELLERVVTKSISKNNAYKKEGVSPSELNDLSMQMFRVFAIAELIDSVVVYFSDNFTELHLKDIISKSNGALLCKALKGFDSTLGYQHKSVLKLELHGFNYINNLMDMLWVGIHGAIEKSHKSQTVFGRYVYGKISENYRRVFESKDNTLPIWYKEAQLLTDAISGMTDGYLISLHDELIKLYKHEYC
ncbi:deoxyguanosinetriphosphate triphosphohydrolase family protein [Aeromonas caviae]|uniref:deoxyguanosinetriphosphate triphosphohydrolase family protein n=1 Tax=Aeromonas caviae TaxID=648 RepID=UPI003A262169